MTSKYADLLARAKEWGSNIVNPSEGGKILSELIVALEELETGIAEALTVFDPNDDSGFDGLLMKERLTALSQPTTDTNGEKA